MSTIDDLNRRISSLLRERAKAIRLHEEATGSVQSLLIERKPEEDRVAKNNEFITRFRAVTSTAYIAPERPTEEVSVSIYCPRLTVEERDALVKHLSGAVTDFVKSSTAGNRFALASAELSLQRTLPDLQRAEAELRKTEDAVVRLDRRIEKVQAALLKEFRSIEDKIKTLEEILNAADQEKARASSSSASNECADGADPVSHTASEERTQTSGS